MVIVVSVLIILHWSISLNILIWIRILVGLNVDGLLLCIIYSRIIVQHSVSSSQTQSLDDDCYSEKEDKSWTNPYSPQKSPTNIIIIGFHLTIGVITTIRIARSTAIRYVALTLIGIAWVVPTTWVWRRAVNSDGQYNKNDFYYCKDNCRNDKTSESRWLVHQISRLISLHRLQRCLLLILRIHLYNLIIYSDKLFIDKKSNYHLQLYV